MKRPLHELGRGEVFRTADGRLWVRCWCSGADSQGSYRHWCQPLHSPGPNLLTPGDTQVEPLDLPALLARLADLEKENRDLRGMVADLWDESRAARLAAEAERGAALALVREWQKHEFRCDTDLVRLLEARGPTRPPVPPCALEGAVRETVAALEGYLAQPPTRGLDGIRLLARLRAALGEGRP